MKKIISIIIILFLSVSAMAIVAPDRWGIGYKLYNASGAGTYWDLMGSAGVQNGSLANVTNVSFGNFTNVTSKTHYIDLMDNSTLGDIVVRSKNASGILTERFRIKAQVDSGNGFVLSEVTVPTVRPQTPVNGSFVGNLTDNTTEIYLNGAWHFTGNGTAR